MNFDPKTAIISVLGLMMSLAVLVFVVRALPRIGRDKSGIYGMGGQTLFIIAVALLGVGGAVASIVIGLLNVGGVNVNP